MIKKVIAFILMCLLVVVPIAGGVGINEVKADETFFHYNIVKTDETTGKPLNGSEFKLLNLDGSEFLVGEEPILEYEENGKWALDVGYDPFSRCAYVRTGLESFLDITTPLELKLIEYQAPDGYDRDETEHSLIIYPDGTILIDETKIEYEGDFFFPNKRTEGHKFTTLNFKKVDENTWEELSDWEFEVKDLQGNLIKKVSDDDASLDLYCTFIISNDFMKYGNVKDVYCYNENGDKVTLISSNGPIWTDGDNDLKNIFKFQETKAPDNYILNDTEMTVSTRVYINQSMDAIEYSVDNEDIAFGSSDGTIVVKNKKDLTKETIDISGKKTWDDNNNQDGKRPKSITVNLLADGVEVDEKQVTDDKWSFDNLPKYKDGKEITYTITEDKVEGYTSEINGYDITNSYTSETINIEGFKTWNDANNQDGKRPESITVNLLADGVEVDEKQVRSIGGSWKYEFKNVPKYDKDDKEITYTITEDAVEGYEVSYDGYDITNTHEPETVRVKGKKIWDDFDNADGLRPESITVTLYKGYGTSEIVIDKKTISAQDNWEYDFGEFPKYENGKIIHYTLTDGFHEEYWGTMINEYDLYNVQYETQKDVTIKKVDTSGKPIADALFEIYEYGTVGNMYDGDLNIYPLFEVSPFTNYINPNKYSFWGKGGYGFGFVEISCVSPIRGIVFNKNKNYHRINRTIISFYTPELKFKDGTSLKDFIDKNNRVPTIDEYDKEDIDYKNTSWYAIDITDIWNYGWTFNGHIFSVNSDLSDISWIEKPEDYDFSLEAKVASIAMYILNGEDEDYKPIDVTDEDMKKVKKLLEDRHLGEVELSGYPSTNSDDVKVRRKIGEFTTNEKGEIKLSDVIYSSRWQKYISKDKDAKSVPGYIKTIREFENSNLILKERNLYPILEIVEKETAHPKYQLDDTVHTINIAEEDEITITNDYTTTDVSFTKEWNNDDVSSRPEEITVELYANDKYVKELTANKADNYTGTFENLLKYEGDELINYTIKEKAVDNYMASVTGDIENGFVITNTYVKPVEVSLEATKKLTGRDLADNQFSFELKQNNETIETVSNKGDKVIFTPIKYTLADVGKKFTYTITEKNDNKPGYTYDTHAETVTVEVTDNGDGTLAADVSCDDDGVIFTNTYSATGTATLSGKKNLTGKDMDTFTFTLKEGDKTIDESTNAKDGTFSFKGIDYSLADVGTHTYTITEKNDGKGGIKYDTHTETVTVNVTDNGDGTLKTEVKTDSDGVVFNNTYSASGKAIIGGKKTLSGKEMDSFTFILKKGEEVVDEATNDGSGNFSFKELSFTLDDIGSHTYTVSEKNDGKGGVDYDTHTETVIVNVSDNGDGTLKVDVKTDNDGVAFNNNYSSSGKINFVGQKNLANKTMEEFSFELKEGNDIIETVKNGTDGKIAFKTITYTLEDVGEHTYTVTEVNDKKPGIAYDTHTETIKVNVTDNGDGTLTATPVYDADGVVFNNTYSATGKTAISGKKVFTNKAMEEFSFSLKEGDAEIATVKNSDTGEFTFPEIEYDLKDVGKHTYTITETNDNKPGVAYDEHVETVTVDVTDNGNGTLKTEAEFDEDGVVFTNTYNADGTFIISGIKKLEGKDLADGDFTFILTDQDGNTKETTVKADGTFEFEPFSFTVDDIGKTFTYKITEKNDENENVTYDEHTEEITISVEDNGDGTLKITPVYDEDGVVFVNKYTEPVVETPTEEPTETPMETPTVETPQETIYDTPYVMNDTGYPVETVTADTGDKSVMPLIIAAILSATGIVATGVALKKRKNN